MKPPPFPTDRASLLRAIREFVGTLHDRIIEHEDPKDDGRRILPKGVQIDDVIVGLLAPSSRTSKRSFDEIRQLIEEARPPGPADGPGRFN